MRVGETNLAVAFRVGLRLTDVTDKNHQPLEGTRLLRIAANGGFLEARQRIGNMYADGDGVAKDTAGAIRLLRRIAACARLAGFAG